MGPLLTVLHTHTCTHTFVLTHTHTHTTTSLVNPMNSFHTCTHITARRFPKELPLGDLQRSLNRLILHQVSTIPATETEQKALMDTLCLFSSQAHVIFDDTNVDTEVSVAHTFTFIPYLYLCCPTFKIQVQAFEHDVLF